MQSGQKNVAVLFKEGGAQGKEEKKVLKREEEMSKKKKKKMKMELSEWSCNQGRI